MCSINGYYYPAGVYLGTLYNGVVPYASLVRAIDSNVVNLITWRQTLGDTGTNNTGGGVITITAGAGSGLLAYVQVPIGPAEAVAAGAAWRVYGTTEWSTAPTFTETIASGSSVTLEFKPIHGWNLPTNNTVPNHPRATDNCSGHLHANSRWPSFRRQVWLPAVTRRTLQPGGGHLHAH